jgi:transcriptional regulator with XRE-family HTH domain
MQNVTHALRFICHRFEVRKSFDVQLGKFLRKTRGELSYIQFSKRTGISHTTLHRLERGEHHLTLNKLETVLNKLKIKLSDVFPDEF